MGATQSRPKTFAHWPFRSCDTGYSQTSTPTPKGSTSIRSSRSCWKPFPNRPTAKESHRSRRPTGNRRLPARSQRQSAHKPRVSARCLHRRPPRLRQQARPLPRPVPVLRQWQPRLKRPYLLLPRCQLRFRLKLRWLLLHMRRRPHRPGRSVVLQPPRPLAIRRLLLPQRLPSPDALQQRLSLRRRVLVLERPHRFRRRHHRLQVAEPTAQFSSCHFSAIRAFLFVAIRHFYILCGLATPTIGTNDA